MKIKLSKEELHLILDALRNKLPVVEIKEKEQVDKKPENDIH